MYCLYLEQGGEGCDYTIGCGQKLEPLEADNLKDALIEAVALIEEYGYHSDHYALEKALIVKTVHSLHGELDMLREKDAAAKKEEALVKKRAELERLKRELGEE